MGFVLKDVRSLRPGGARSGIGVVGIIAMLQGCYIFPFKISFKNLKNCLDKAQSILYNMAENGFLEFQN